MIVIFIIYFLTAKIGLSLDAIGGFAALFWLPSGIALASMLLFGYRYWPSIAIGAFLINFIIGAPWFTAITIGVGNTLEALIGMHILKNIVGFKTELRSLKDIFSLLVFAGLISTMIGATIGVSSLYLSGLISGATYVKAWFSWWFGNTLGILVATPLILVLFNYKYYKNILKMSSYKAVEAVILTLLIIFVNLIIFYDILVIKFNDLPIAYLIFPFLILASVRFCRIGATISIFITSMIAVMGTAKGLGPFVLDNLSSNLLFLQVFVGLTAIIMLILATITNKIEN